MPYKSLRQERWAHSDTGIKALGGKDKVKEWDTASKGLKLPEAKALTSPGYTAKLKMPTGQ